MVVASLSIPYRSWSRHGCCVSGGTYCQSSFFGNLHQKQTCHARWYRSLYSGKSAINAVETGCHSWSYHLHRVHWNTCSELWDCVHWLEARVPAGLLRSTPLGLYATTHPAASQQYWCSWLERQKSNHYDTVRWEHLLELLKLIGNGHITGHSSLLSANLTRFGLANINIQGNSVYRTMTVDLTSKNALLSLSICPYLDLPPPVKSVNVGIEAFWQHVTVQAKLWGQMRC